MAGLGCPCVSSGRYWLLSVYEQNRLQRFTTSSCLWFRDFLGRRWWSSGYCHWAWSWRVGWHPAQPQPIPREVPWKFPLLHCTKCEMTLMFLSPCYVYFPSFWDGEQNQTWTQFSILINFRFVQWHIKILNFFLILEMFHNHDFSL